VPLRRHLLRRPVSHWTMSLTPWPPRTTSSWRAGRRRRSAHACGCWITRRAKLLLLLLLLLRRRPGWTRSRSTGLLMLMRRRPVHTRARPAGLLLLLLLRRHPVHTLARSVGLLLLRRRPVRTRARPVGLVRVHARAESSPARWLQLACAPGPLLLILPSRPPGSDASNVELTTTAPQARRWSHAPAGAPAILRCIGAMCRLPRLSPRPALAPGVPLPLLCLTSSRRHLQTQRPVR
jgi:hypothetical protein